MLQWNYFYESTMTKGNPSCKVTRQCKSEHKYIHFYC